MRIGAWCDAEGTHLRVWSRWAKAIHACRVDPDTCRIIDERPLRPEGQIWCARSLDWPAGSAYRLRLEREVDGAMRSTWILDPMARWVDLTQPEQPLALLVDEVPAAGRLGAEWPSQATPGEQPRMRLLYELHPRGFTQLQTAIPEGLRGSIEALAHPWSIDYFLRLGVTTLCLMPISAHVDEPRLRRLGLSNYWGYNVVAWSAPHPAYLATCRNAKAQECWQEARQALRSSIATLHAAGLEVVLDVVYNHSAELDAEGPVFHLRELDPSLHYRIDARGELQNWSGCGNTLNFASPHVGDWVLQSLRDWVLDYGIDGFRFDLAATVSRNCPDGSIAPRDQGYFWNRLAIDPVLQNCLLIAEPWDLGPQGYQIGAFPAQVLEWNDRYRDELRRFWICEDAPIGRLADRLAGSSAIFATTKLAPAASVNYLASHDGFTLRDALSYNHKHNTANGEANRDGHDQNHSHNHGYEGGDAPAEVLAIRRSKHKALLACLLMSLGTPMLQAGDEWGRSQHGNNNAYCQDNALSWLRWEECDAELLAFSRALMPARRRCQHLLNTHWWLSGEEAEGLGPVHHDRVQAAWLHPEGRAMQPADWDQPSVRALMLHLQPCIASRVNDQEQALEGPERVQMLREASAQSAPPALVLINAHPWELNFRLPSGEWKLLADRPGTRARGELLLPGYSVECAVGNPGDRSAVER